MNAPSPTTILVRTIADERMSHGDRTFAAGYAIIIGGGTAIMLGAVALRWAGWL